MSIKNKQKMHKTFYRKSNDFEKQIYKKNANLLTRVKAYRNDYTFNINFIKIEIIHSKLGIQFAS